ncbi:tetratricopeptide repeat protein [Rapidithrix thailandica]|uniref:Tetratricopeptide repeat protein n=1 Tax=Rapidithrix thailandica TaxID=413964 RepID=A0AAW9RY19_9BACT
MSQEASNNQFDIHYQNAWDLVEQKDLENALIEANACIVLDADNPNAYYLRGYVYSAMENWPAAIENFNQALDIAPEFIHALYYRGMALFKEGQVEEALEDFLQCANTWPTHGPTRISIANCYDAMEEQEQADKYAFEAQMIFAREALQNGQFERMAQHLQEAEQCCCNRTAFNRLKAKYHLALGQFEEVVLLLHTVIESEEANQYDYLDRADALMEMARYEKALADYSTILQTDAERVDALRGVALCQIHLGNYPQGISFLKKLYTSYDFDLHARIYYFDANQKYAEFLLAAAQQGKPVQMHEVAQCYINMENGEKCLSFLEPFEQHGAPLDAALQTMKAKALKLCNRNNEAIEVYQQLVESKEAGLEEYFDLAELLHQNRAYTEEVTVLEAAEPLLEGPESNGGLHFDNLLDSLEDSFNQPSTTKAQYYLRLGLAYMRLGNNPKALGQLDLAHACDETLGTVLYERARVYMDLNEFDRSLEDFAHARKLKVSHAMVLFQEAWVYYYQKDTDKAIEAIEELGNYYNQSSNIAHLEGMVWQDAQEYEKALEAYNRSIAYGSNDPYTWRNRGVVYRVLEHYYEASEDLQEFIKNYEFGSSDYINGMSQLGWLYYAEQKYEKAANIMQEVIASSYAEASDYRLLGEIYKNDKKYEEALPYFDKALEFQQDFGIAHASKANCLMQLNRYQEALKGYVSAAESGEDPGFHYQNAAFTCFKMHDHQGVIKYIFKSYEFRTEDYWAMNRLGEAYLGLQQYEKALVEYTKIHKLKDDEQYKRDAWRLYTHQAKCYLGLNQYEEAKKYLILSMGFGDYLEQYKLLANISEAEGNYLDAYTCYQYCMLIFQHEGSDASEMEEKMKKLAHYAEEYQYTMKNDTETSSGNTAEAWL